MTSWGPLLFTLYRAPKIWLEKRTHFRSWCVFRVSQLSAIIQFFYLPKNALTEGFKYPREVIFRWQKRRHCLYHWITKGNAYACHTCLLFGYFLVEMSSEARLSVFSLISWVRKLTYFWSGSQSVFGDSFAPPPIRCNITLHFERI